MALQIERAKLRPAVVMRCDSGRVLGCLVTKGREVVVLLECQRGVRTQRRSVFKAAVRKTVVLWYLSLTPLTGYWISPVLLDVGNVVAVLTTLTKTWYVELFSVPRRNVPQAYAFERLQVQWHDVFVTTSFG